MMMMITTSVRRELQCGVRRGVESAEQRRSPRPADFWKWTSFGCEVDQSSRPFGSCGRELAGWQEEWLTPSRESTY